MLFEIMRDQINHHQLQLGLAAPNTAEDDGLGARSRDAGLGAAAAAAAAANDRSQDLHDLEAIRSQALLKVLEVVYVGAFPSPDDQAAVRAMAERQLRLQPAGGRAAVSVDATAPGLLRVGSIYLAKGGSHGRMPHAACLMPHASCRHRPPL